LKAQVSKFFNVRPGLNALLAKSVDGQWCTQLPCTTCGAFEIRSALYLLFHNCNPSKQYLNGRLAQFPRDAGSGKDGFVDPELSANVCEQIVSIFAEGQQHDEAVLRTTRTAAALKIADDLNLSEADQCQDGQLAELVYSMCPSNLRAGVAGNLALAMSQRFTGIGDPHALSMLLPRLHATKIITLSAIELFLTELPSADARFIDGQLREFSIEHREVGWVHQFHEKKREMRRCSEAQRREEARNAARKGAVREAKQLFLRDFEQADAIEKLKIIAADDFNYKIEFIPARLVPTPSEILMLGLENLSRCEILKIINWVGRKSGRWAQVRETLRRPTLIVCNARTDINRTRQNGRVRLSVIPDFENND
jgi:hypothetical protein